jgi:hypothetical protein
MSKRDSRTRSGKAAVASTGLRAEVERLIAKERFKDAVKEAKLCYKEEATPENRLLLERAYFLRARQLLRAGLRESAIEVAQHLLEFGVTAVDWLEELVRLLASIGLPQAAFQLQERLGSPVLKGRIAEVAADQLVLRPERGGAVSPELARDAASVRLALEKLHVSDEAGAILALRDLARSSPLSEWKFFVRGLAAFYREDAAETKANWDRLDPDRAACSIAKRLRGLGMENPDAVSPKLAAMETVVFGEPILDRVHQLRRALAGHEWDQVIRLLDSLRRSLARVDAKLAERLTAAVIGSLVKAVQDMSGREAERLVSRFIRAAQPLTIDPRWNRLWAIVRGRSRAELSQEIRHWIGYLDDLATLEVFDPSESPLAQAIVWNRVAELRRIELDWLTEQPERAFPPFARSRPPVLAGTELSRARRGIVDALSRSLELAPRYLPSHRLLVEVYGEWDDTHNMGAAANRLLEVFPDDDETLTLMAVSCHARGDLAAALGFVQRARRLKPLDDSLRALEWTIRIGRAREAALASKWDDGRAEFAAAALLRPGDSRDYTVLVRRAIFELKAGETARSDEYVRDAQSRTDAAALWLALLIESIRHELPASVAAGYNSRWEAELKKKYRSQAAGEMAAILHAFLGSDITYRGRPRHVEQLVAYLARGTRSKSRREDVEWIVEFLELVPGEDDLLERVVKAGVKRHPDSALLNLRAGVVEWSRRSMFGLGASGRRYLENALKLAEASTDPRVTARLEEIRAFLSVVHELTEQFCGVPPFFSPFSRPRSKSQPAAARGRKSRRPSLPPFLPGLGLDNDAEDAPGFDDEDVGDVFWGGPGQFPIPGPVGGDRKRSARRRR